MINGIVFKVISSVTNSEQFTLTFIKKEHISDKELSFGIISGNGDFRWTCSGAVPAAGSLLNYFGAYDSQIGMQMKLKQRKVIRTCSPLMKENWKFKG